MARPSVSTRAIVFGLALLPITVYWMSVAELKYNSQATALPIFVYPVCVLFLLAVGSLPIRRYWPQAALRSGELLTIYVMLVGATSLGAYGMMQDLFAVIAHPYQYATPENDWQALFFRYIPVYLTPDDPAALDAYYEGGSSLHVSRHLRAWARPALVWGVFACLIVWMMLCVNTLLRRQWIERERLVFPIVQLPLALARSGSFFRSRLLWIGFGMVAAIDLIDGLHVLYPAVPGINVKLYDIGRFFPEKPWSAMGSTRTSLYPFMVGIGFFLPLDLSFSCWVFFVIRQLVKVLSSYVGAQRMPGFPYFHEQSAGAWTGLCLIALWLSRRHLQEAVVSAWRGAREADGPGGPDGPMSYRTAMAGLLAGAGGLMLFCRVAGLSVIHGAVFFGLYFMIAIAVTRVRAEFGAPHGIFNHPLDIMVTTLGTNVIGAQNLTSMSFLFWFNRGYRPHPMPNQLEALKLAQSTRMDARRLVVAMLLATVVSVIAVFWIDLSLIYREGATAGLSSFRLWVGSGAFNNLQRWLSYPRDADALRVGFMSVGVAVISLLYALRLRFLAWPLHPAGYALAVSSAVDYFWFPLFLSWSLKLLVLRLGGAGGYRRAIPFFLALILGDLVAGGLWMIFGVITGRQVYMFFI
ncbi:hypothetical protein HN371_24130 [Candidatus Poribacteria bacterium]|jgi:hypothetical protein|nr:hypothetical protein [Candidatus Poribacteria bacterium]MBT5535525.1 hypothetical protein [Candidatus Poribacteria bacterium]MBT5712660.1 hypothetical protein [Candidatus Poribacteria bacterium]